MFQMNLGERVKNLREKKGWNQKELSDRCGITQATISRLESGLVNQLKSDALGDLAKSLGVSVDYLIGQTNTLTADEAQRCDEEVQYLFRGYEKLSSDGKEELKDFLKWLENKEKKGKKR